MTLSRQHVLLETESARQRAVELLKQLQAAHIECEAQLKAEQRPDNLKNITGKSSLEEAIQNTQRMIELIDRAMQEAREMEIGDQIPVQTRVHEPGRNLPGEPVIGHENAAAASLFSSRAATRW